MKKGYKVLFVVLCVAALTSFLPWLYDIAFPTSESSPFVAYSPVSNCFVVSQSDDDGLSITMVDNDGEVVATKLSKNDRDSLLPQMYFNQPSARAALPDSIAGKDVDIPMLKNQQWVFNSSPRDINKAQSGVYPIMESLPKRVELEDPTEVFLFTDGKIRFLEMSSNSENAEHSRRFQQVLDSRGFALPILSANANITARKAYDEGYLITDANGQLYHMKMQAGQPYVSVINLPEGVKSKYAFILENPDRKHIGLAITDDGSLFAIEREGYKAVRLPIENVNPAEQRITIFKNPFNWVIKTSDADCCRWIAMDSETYGLLGAYSQPKHKSQTSKIIKNIIFPFKITFTDIDDCYAYPRISEWSATAMSVWCVIGIVIILTILIVKRKKQK